MYFILHTVRSFSRRYKTRNIVDLTSALNADACANDAPHTHKHRHFKTGWLRANNSGASSRENSMIYFIFF